MKTKRPPAAAPLAHLTAVHLLGRILERLDHKGDDQVKGHTRYQQAMRHLSDALDRVEQSFVVRQILEAHSAPVPVPVRIRK